MSHMYDSTAMKLVISLHVKKISSSGEREILRFQSHPTRLKRFIKEKFTQTTGFTRADVLFKAWVYTNLIKISRFRVSKLGMSSLKGGNRKNSELKPCSSQSISHLWQECDRTLGTTSRYYFTLEIIQPLGQVYQIISKNSA